MAQTLSDAASPPKPARSSGAAAGPALRRLFLVGTPNVGKSVLFNALTGSYAVVSNYPGTTVEVARGRATLGGEEWEVVDTPGMYSLRPITEEERVARDLLVSDGGAIVHVVDAKNLPRHLAMTLELAQLGRPLVLVCNLMDEACRAGVSVDFQVLSRKLGFPVVTMVATRGEGLAGLKAVLATLAGPPRLPLSLSPALAAAHAKVLAGLGGRPDAGFWALRHLEGDPAATTVAPVAERGRAEALRGLPDGRSSSVAAAVAADLRLQAAGLLEGAFSESGSGGRRLQDRLDAILLGPWLGFPILAAVLYVGLYLFVGVFGGQTLVGFLENDVFVGRVNPFLEWLFARLLPWPVWRSLFVGDFGIFTLGFRYAIALILPIVGTFFLAFSVLEDTGYLPRLAMMLNRAFQGIGLNGRAVIPLILGFGCDTMATMVTRVLESRRERLIATFLLALAIPCSAQIGLILGLLAGHPGALLIWAGAVLGIFLAAGTLMARLMPGERAPFFMELPPLRWPSLKNVASKTVSRMGWYLWEVVPLFVAASVLLWLGTVTGLFPRVVALVEPAVRFLGLPAQAAPAFLFGFFRRDYGAAGLYDLQKAGALSGVQLAVACVTLTLFLPCVAQFLMMKKERGWRVTLLMSGAIFAVALGAGWALDRLLVWAGWTL